MNSKIQPLGGEIQEEMHVRASDNPLGAAARERVAPLTSAESKIFRVAATVAIGGFLVGFDATVISGAVPSAATSFESKTVNGVPLISVAIPSSCHPPSAF